MARGNTAKGNVIEKIKNAFGTDFIGEFDKKVYVWADDGGEKVQISLTLTCPKTLIGAGQPVIKSTTKLGELNFEDPVVEIKQFVNADLSEQEQETINDLIRRLGL